jgi:hypothetical protein
VHRSITLVNLQLDAQDFMYLYTIHLLKSSFSIGAQDSHLQRVTIPETAYMQLRPRPPEDEQGNARNI